jgi:hypothetical protein
VFIFGHQSEDQEMLRVASVVLALAAVLSNRTYEQLYYERADTSALRWTYFAFHRAHPETDTREGVEAIGYSVTAAAMR